MNLAELITEVNLLTKRPDLQDRTKSAVKSAVLKLHTLEYWSKDLFETAISFPTAEITQRFMYKVAIPRWRALKYIRKVDETTLTPYDRDLKYITPEAFMDDYNEAKDNVVYESGQSLQIRCSEEVKIFLMGCYLLPDTTDEGFTSWIADDYPWAVIYDAASAIFRSIGFTEQEGSMKVSSMEHMTALRLSNVQGIGY
jgi:hypothetical protein